jgi:hypothetical protein
MAYSVSNDWITKCYSGESLYSCRLYIDNYLVPIKQISKITINSPIIDNSSQDKPFYIGTFISQSITIKFKNLDGLNISSGKRVNLYIGQIVDDEDTYEEIPIGKYLIDELAENYQETCEITCLDYAVLFATNCDYSSALTDGMIEIDDLLEWICDKYGVELGSYPSTNGTVEVGSYDNTQSAKFYISCIAEIKGCNAKMDRNGALTLVPIKSSSTRTINALKSKSWKLGEKYVIKKVIYFDAVRNYSFGAESINLNYNNNPLYYQNARLGFISASDRGNTVFIRQDNPFIVDNVVVENIYNAVKDLEVWSLKCENYGDLSLDAWDIVTYTLGEESYSTFYSNTTTYEMTVMSTNETQIPNKLQEVTTNVVGGTPDQKIRKVSTEINNIEGRITLMAKDIDANYKEFSEFTVESDKIVARVSRAEQDIKDNKDSAQDQIDSIKDTLQDGVSLVKTTSVTIDNAGLSVSTSDSNISTTMTNSEFRVQDNTGTKLIYMGYDVENQTSVSEMDNLTVNRYFVAGYHRIEKMESEGRTGWFYVGD